MADNSFRQFTSIRVIGRNRHSIVTILQLLLSYSYYYLTVTHNCYAPHDIKDFASQILKNCSDNRRYLAFIDGFENKSFLTFC